VNEMNSGYERAGFSDATYAGKITKRRKLVLKNQTVGEKLGHFNFLVTSICLMLLGNYCNVIAHT